MTVKDLIEKLQDFPQDYEVWSNTGYYGYEDYPCDLERLGIKENVDEKRVYIAESL